MSLRFITSRQNEIYRLFKALTEHHSRKKQGAFLLEGSTFVLEALEDEPLSVLTVALTPEFAETERGKAIIAKAQQRRIPVTLMAPALLDEIAPSETPQGVIAAVRQPTRERLERIEVPTSARVVVIEGLQDPSNVGAIIRTADAIGALAVLYTKGTADPYTPKSVRASAGSLLHVPVVMVSSFEEAVEWLKGNEFQIVGTVPQGGVSVFEANFADRVAVLIGNEARGLSQEAKQKSDLLVTIPMLGKASSLNAAVAAGVVLYEILRQQSRKGILHPTDF
ncbi:MAG: RNA methyltransferase [Armatimonadetes bacterium]|nr:RNA methyltransferase [Armatimonadota bacterium]MCX7967632.1 RNA methyltransferase [Armatimonadota bacterium]MDW8142873.1 RNA methyltransferase [Armatimonadota bacterium]